MAVYDGPPQATVRNSAGGCIRTWRGTSIHKGKLWNYPVPTLSRLKSWSGEGGVFHDSGNEVVRLRPRRLCFGRKF